MNDLHARLKSEELWFWGKIIGSEFDYYIAMGINYKNHYEFPEKIFYYGTSVDFIFNPLPETMAQHLPDMKKHNNTLLKGDPKTIIESYEDPVDPDAVEKEKEKEAEQAKEKMSEEEELAMLDESVDQEVKQVEKRLNFTELCKLSFIVRAIDYSTNIFPKGGFKILPIHEIRRNDTFKGLKPEELMDIKNYHYFRPISTEERKKIIESDEAIFRNDFLDCVDEDPVKGSWTMQLDSTKQIVKIINIFLTKIILNNFYRLI
jgi:radial spoke head protein 9